MRRHEGEVLLPKPPHRRLAESIQSTILSTPILTKERIRERHHGLGMSDFESLAGVAAIEIDSHIVILQFTSNESGPCQQTTLKLKNVSGTLPTLD
jgi:hypothetical protein